MSATLAAAVKAHIEQQGLGVPVFKNHAPINKADGTPQGRPYVVVTDSIGNTSERTGDNTYKRAQELVQVDIYEDAGAESPTLAKDTTRALVGARLATAPQFVYRVELFGGPNRVEVPGSEPALVRNTLTLNIRRRL